MNTAKLFKNGKSQAVRLPREFKFQGTEVYIKRIGPQPRDEHDYVYQHRWERALVFFKTFNLGNLRLFRQA